MMAAAAAAASEMTKLADGDDVDVGHRGAVRCADGVVLAVTEVRPFSAGWRMRQIGGYRCRRRACAAATVWLAGAEGTAAAVRT